MKKNIARLILSLILIAGPAGFALSLSGIYDRIGIISEHGLHGAVPEENIDLFTGNLTLRSLDIRLPGKNGLDVEIWRVYNSKVVRDRLSWQGWSIQQDPHSWVGLGWTMHMGRIHNYLTDQPVIEFPDGRMETAYPSLTDPNIFFTRDFLRYDKLNQTLYFQDGRKWIFGDDRYLDYLGTQALVVTEIRNQFGNHIAISYEGSESPNMASITDTFGRPVTFETDSVHHWLKSISAGGHTYSYTVNNSFQNGYFKLIQFQPPALDPVEYEYAENGQSDHFELTAVNTSYDGRMEYTYNDQDFYFYSQFLETRVVSQKQYSLLGSGDGTWIYTYPDYQGETGTVSVDGPEFDLEVTYHAYSATARWKIGLLQQRAASDGSFSEQYDWISQKISDTHWWVLNVDLGTVKAPLQNEVIRTQAGNATGRDVYVYTNAATKKYGLPDQIIHYGGSSGGSLLGSEEFDYAFITGDLSEAEYMVSYVKNHRLKDAGGALLKGVATEFWSNGAPQSITRSGGTNSYEWTYTDPGSEGEWIEVNLPGAGGTETYHYTRGVLSGIERPTFTELSREIESATSWVYRETNQHGETMTFSRDGLGRITKIDFATPGFNDVQVTWNNQSAEIAQGYHKVVKYWDGLGRDTGYTEQSKGQDGTPLLYYRKTLDAEGRVKTENKGSINSAHKYIYTWNSAGLVTKIRDPLGKDTDYSYGDTRKTVKDANGREWKYDYWSLPGAVNQVIDPCNQTTRYEYDAAGRLLSARIGLDPPGPLHEYTYNVMDQVLTEDHPGTGTSTYTYSPAANLSQMAWGGATVNYSYNSSNQLTGAAMTCGDASLNETIDYAYDSNGRLSGVDSTAGWGRTIHGYNTLGAITRETQAIPGLSPDPVVLYAYDQNNNLASITYPDGRQAVYTNNGLNLPRTLAFAGQSLASSVSYGAGGQPVEIVRGNGTTYTAAYNNAGWLAGARLALGTTDLYRVAYGFDNVGNITSLANTKPSLNAVFAYDWLNRLTAANYTSGVKRVDAFTYAYDSRGNILTVQEDGNVVWSATCDDGDRIGNAGFGYDGRGNLTARPAGAESTLLDWDGWNRLRSAREPAGLYRQRFLYDERGLRLKKWASAESCFPVPPGFTGYYVYSYDGRLLAEYDSQNRCVRDYLYLGERLAAEYRPVESKYLYPVPDQIRSTRLLTDGTGQVVFSAAWDPFGGPLKTWTAETWPNRKFSGKERDDILGLDDFGARYYAWGLYRFISTDPVLDLQAAIENPQKWNRYAYCLNNPVLRFDPNGLDSVTSNASVQQLMLSMLERSHYGQIYGEWSCSALIDQSGQVKNGLIRHSANESTTKMDIIIGAQFALHTHPTETHGPKQPTSPKPSGIDSDKAKANKLPFYIISKRGVWKVDPTGKVTEEEKEPWVITATKEKIRRWAQDQQQNPPQTRTVPLPEK